MPPKWTSPQRRYRNDESSDGAMEIRLTEGSSTQPQIASNKLYFYGDITSESVLGWNKQLEEVSKNVRVIQTIYDLESPPPVYIYIQSNGGEIFAALSTVGRISELKDSGINVTTIVEGFAASAATFISVCGSTRLIRRHSCMMIHQLSSGFWGTYREFQDEKRNVEMMMEMINGIYKTYTSFDINGLHEILEHDLYLSPEECLAKGLVDSVL